MSLQVHEVKKKKEKKSGTRSIEYRCFSVYLPHFISTFFYSLSFSEWSLDFGVWPYCINQYDSWKKGLSCTCCYLHHLHRSLSVSSCASIICTNTTITIYHFLCPWVVFFLDTSGFLSFSSKTYIRRLGLKLRKPNWNIGRKWQRKVWVKLLLQFVRFFSFLLVLVTLLLFSVSFHPFNNYLQVSF